MCMRKRESTAEEEEEERKKERERETIRKNEEGNQILPYKYIYT